VLDVTVLIGLATFSIVCGYLVLRPLLRTQERLHDRIVELEQQVIGLRQAADQEFVRSVRAVAPSSLLRHVRLAIWPTDLLAQALTRDEVEYLRHQQVSLPELSIEFWRAHIVLRCSFNDHGHRRNTEFIAFDLDASRTLSLWETRVGEREDWPMLSPKVELQYDTRASRLTFGAVLGRFGDEDHFDHLLPTPEFRWVDLVLTDEGLAQWRVAPDPDDATAIDRKEWRYECESAPDLPVRWNAVVRNIGKYDQWSVELTLPASAAG